MFSLNCVAKLSVCCHHSNKIGNFEEISEENHAEFVDNLIKTHEKALQFVEKTNSIYKFVSLGQLLNAMALIAVVSFQIRSSVDNVVFILITVVLSQLLCYCFFGEYISIMVRKNYV